MGTVRSLSWVITMVPTSAIEEERSPRSVEVESIPLQIQVIITVILIQSHFLGASQDPWTVGNSNPDDLQGSLGEFGTFWLLFRVRSWLIQASLYPRQRDDWLPSFHMRPVTLIKGKRLRLLTSAAVVRPFPL